MPFDDVGHVGGVALRRPRDGEGDLDRQQRRVEAGARDPAAVVRRRARQAGHVRPVEVVVVGERVGLGDLRVGRADVRRLVRPGELALGVVGARDLPGQLGVEGVDLAVEHRDPGGGAAPPEVPGGEEARQLPLPVGARAADGPRGGGERVAGDDLRLERVAPPLPVEPEHAPVVEQLLPRRRHVAAGHRELGPTDLREGARKGHAGVAGDVAGIRAGRQLGEHRGRARRDRRRREDGGDRREDGDPPHPAYSPTPWTSCAASITASATVGCAWIISPTSRAEIP